jgi:NAD-dependent SIR2 family protein deacetylase
MLNAQGPLDPVDIETRKLVQLHGALDSLVCTLCKTTVPFCSTSTTIMKDVSIPTPLNPLPLGKRTGMQLVRRPIS